MAARKGAARLAREWASVRARRRDRVRPTYVEPSVGWPARPGLARYLAPLDAGTLRAWARPLADAAERYLAHRFDLLGSGPVEVRHGLEARGVEGHRYGAGPGVEPDPDGAWLIGRINPANLDESRRLWRLIEPGYTPIDWHVDFKSGYRWPETTPSAEITYGRAPGADVKVPWELSRMQHLPQLALAHALARDGAAGFAPAAAYTREFRHEVLDFVATNPPRFGVNWCCTMDVAIRIANCLVAFDLFRAYGADFDDRFVAELARTVYAHGRHVVANLEWSAELRGNHYLSNVVGLLFVAAYLPSTPETDAWLAFAVQELVREVLGQFTADGASFEGSTSYHRLAAELAAYATALTLALPPDRQAALRSYDHRRHSVQPRLEPAPLALHRIPGVERPIPLPPAYLERLERMAEFTLHATRPDGRVPLIGDVDGGRFLRLEPQERPEEASDHRHLIAAVSGLFDREDLAMAVGRPALDAAVVRRMAGGVRLPSYRRPGESSAAERAEVEGDRAPITLECRPGCGAGAGGGRGLREGLVRLAYPGFGLYLYRSARLYLAVRCGPVGQGGNGGHAHNDQLAIEVAVDGLPFFVDPGSYLYTPVHELRNRFRATAMHNTLAVDGLEQNRWPEGFEGLFTMPERAHARALAFTDRAFAGEHSGFGAVHRRTITVCERALHGLDECAVDGEKRLRFHLAPAVEVEEPGDGRRVRLAHGGVRLELSAESGAWVVEGGLYAPTYGVARGTTVLSLPTRAAAIRWDARIVR